MAKRKDYLVRSMMASLAFHAALLSLQFGSPGMGLPWPSFAWNERKATVPAIHAVLRGQMPAATPQIKATVTQPSPLRIAARTKPDTPPVAPIPASVADQPGEMTARLGTVQASTPPPATPKSAPLKKNPPQAGGSAVLSTDKETPWKILAEKPVAKTGDESRDDRFAIDKDEDAEALKEKELALQRRLTQAAESKRQEGQARVAAEEARERDEALARLAEEKMAAEQAAVARTATQAAQERAEALKLARLAEEVEEQAAVAKAREEELKRNEALARMAEEKRKEDQAALAKAKDEAWAAQAESRAREQAESAAARPPAQAAVELGAGSSSSTMAGKPGGGADLARRALDMARNGLAGLPGKASFDTERSRRGSLLGRNPSDIQLSFYGDSWMQKVERIASLNYPRLSKNRSYGVLVMTVIINSDGSLAEVRIVKGSGSAELDAAARHIVEMSAPFSAFPPDLKRNYDVVDITRTLSFPEKPPLIFGQ